MTKTPKIMVVEDETLLLQAVTSKLQKLGYEVVSCSSGNQALDYLENLPELPDAIWLDYYLKDMNGLEFMTKVRDKKEWQNIPVLIVSNSASPEKVDNMMALGAKQYILKAEHRLEEIVNLVSDMIKQDE